MKKVLLGIVTLGMLALVGCTSANVEKQNKGPETKAEQINRLVQLADSQNQK